MLGCDLVSGLDGHEVTGLTRSELDITDEAATMAALEGFDVVINAAAFTAVDDAQQNEDLAFAINADGTRNLAKACRKAGAILIQVSTDYVFDGESRTPYPECAAPNPLSVYGASKWAGEQAVLEEHPEGSLIVRTSWLYGTHGNSFPRTILRAGLQRETLDVVNDQVGQPTWTKDVVAMIKSLISEGITNGIFHATNSGQTTWQGFATQLFQLAGWDATRVHPATTASFPRPAPRPAWSVLGHDNWGKHGIPEPRSWDLALNEAWGAGLSQWALKEGDTR
jgi:dTDP-4-dehydrorhamnose reductase